MKKSFLILRILMMLLFISVFLMQPELVNAASGCASSTPPSRKYTIMLCFTSPSDGGVLSGNVTVAPAISFTAGSGTVQHIIYYLSGQYLLTAFQKPYSLVLNSALFVDGSASLTFVAQMSDGYTTVNPASINVTLSNGVTSPPVNTNTFTPALGTPGSPFVVAAAGDGAGGETNSLNVSNLISSINPNLFLYLGDVYENGSLTEFYNWYGSGTNYFSKFNSITDPTVGNHEYTGKLAPGYFYYWNNVPNYYSFNTGGWHFVSLNSITNSVPANVGSAQYSWLQADLAANTSPCVLVYWHEPLFNVGQEGAANGMSDVWKLLAQDKVTLVLNGHDHDYQRWTAMDANGSPNPKGVTEFIVGTAGHGIQSFVSSDSRMLVGFDATNRQFGVLRLELNSNSANFQFVNTSSVVKDSGTITCQGSGGSGPTATPTVSNTPVNTDTPTAVSSITPTPINTPVNTPTPTNTPVNTPTSTNTPVNTPTATATSAGSTTINPTADAYVNSANPTTNYGISKTLYVDNSPIERSYVQFNVAGLSKAPSKVTLKIFANSTSTTGFDVYSVSDNTWTETGINYSNALAFAATKTGSSGAIKTAGQFYSVDVTALVTGNGQVSFGLSTTNNTAINLSSRESGADAPQLVITP
ncbi:MAG: DNRLRE domain-containing protein [Anaerolineaceae bacterium]|nr:DNRLRE domain-containing protein [Anaerolineaceae bacterium]